MINVTDYHEGFYDGMKLDQKYPQTLQIMGKSLEEIIALIIKDKEEFYSGQQWTKEDLTKMEVRKKREEFRKALADLGHGEATQFNHLALEAYDKVHCPELRKTVIHFTDESLNHGVVRLQTTQDGLELWVGGKLKYQWCKDNDK